MLRRTNEAYVGKVPLEWLITPEPDVARLKVGNKEILIKASGKFHELKVVAWEGNKSIDLTPWIVIDRFEKIIRKKEFVEEFGRRLSLKIATKIEAELDEHMIRKIFERSKEIKPISGGAKDLATDPLWLLKLHNVFNFVIADEIRTRMLCFIAALSVFLKELKYRICLEIKGLPSSGKNYIVDRVLDAFPDEKLFKCTSITPKVLRRVGRDLKIDFTNYCLYVSERGILDQSIDVRLLTSEHELRTLATEKDEVGRNVVELLITRGRPPILTTSAEVEINPQYAARFLFVTTDTSEEHRKRVLALQRELASNPRIEGDFKVECPEFKDVVRLLDKHVVKIPKAICLDVLPVEFHNVLRDNIKFLGIVQTIAIAHQYQRPFFKYEDEYYLIALPIDVALAVGLSWDVLVYSSLGLPEFEFNVLEKIHELFRSKTTVRIDEVARAIKWPMEFVTDVVKSLERKGYLDYDSKAKKVNVELGLLKLPRKEGLIEPLSNILKSDVLKRILSDYAIISPLHRKLLTKEFKEMSQSEAFEFCYANSLSSMKMLLDPNSPFHFPLGITAYT